MWKPRWKAATVKINLNHRISGHILKARNYDDEVEILGFKLKRNRWRESHIEHFREH